MGSKARACWVVAASVGAVEALKDQGFCRWNYALRSLHQHAKTNLRSTSLFSSSSSTAASYKKEMVMVMVMRENGNEKSKQAEESLRKVMYLSCWGPN